MEREIRTYILRILAAHVAALVLVVAVIGFAGVTLYDSAREQAAQASIDQARRPAQQAADGIRRHATRAFDVLAVAAAAPGSQGVPEVQLDAAWTQLREVASDLLVVRHDGATPVVVRHVANTSAQDTAASDLLQVLVAESVSPGATLQDGLLARTARRAADTPGTRIFVGPADLGGVATRPAALTAMGLRQSGLVLVAVLPADYLDRSFLALGRDPGRLGLTLVTSDGDPLLPEATSATSAAWPDQLREFVRARLGGQSLPAPWLDDDVTVTGETYRGAIPAVAVVRGPGEAEGSTVAAEPQSTGTREGTAGVASVLDAQAALGRLEEVGRASLIWAVVLIVAISTILVSSGIQLVRGRARLERLRAEVVERELDEARKIQLRWLPGRAGRLAHGRVDVAAENLPASHISGDFYNYFELPADEGRPPQVALVVGDVTGHGIAAAFLMSSTQLLIETALLRTRDPGRALTEVNDQLARQAHGGQFVTIAVVVVDFVRDQLLIAAAGHPGPLRCDADGRWHDTDVDADLVAGVLEGVTYATTRVPLAGVRMLLLYTDGATEAVNGQGDRIDLRQFAEGLRTENPAGPASAGDAVEAGLRVVRGFAGGRLYDDDITLLAAALDPRPEPTTDSVQLPSDVAGDTPRPPRRPAVAARG